MQDKNSWLFSPSSLNLSQLFFLLTRRYIFKINYQRFLKLWGMYWRYLVSLVVLLILSATLDNQFGLLDGTAYTSFKPTIVWASIAIVLSLFALVQNKGLPYVFLGYRLSLNNSVWIKFNKILISFFITLSLLNYVVYMFAGLEFWKVYKLFGQTSLLIIFPLFGVWWVYYPYKQTK
ncbi:septation protein IspZ [Thalassotalea atypica]|uniref:septation protein IspZ n=1 Tax=Thalassotalea atypica TaxID=2054316 RepID=UPI0025730134|nr:septation protein IspZ [Thalassotalea atypica]